MKTPSGRRPSWKALVYRYTLECKVRPHHRVYVSVTALLLALFSNSGYLGFGYPRVIFLLIEFPLHYQIMCLLILHIYIFWYLVVCTHAHKGSRFFFYNWYQSGYTRILDLILECLSLDSYHVLES
jgi:hypothetical protein